MPMYETAINETSNSTVKASHARVNKTPHSSMNETPNMMEVETPHSTVNETPNSAVNETTSSQDATVRVKQEPVESLSFLEKQARRAEYLQTYLSPDAANGDGFIPLNYSIETPGSYSSVSTASTTVASPLQNEFGLQENPFQGHCIPLGAQLFNALENNQINPEDYYIKDIQPIQRRHLLLQNKYLMPLLHRKHVYLPLWAFHS